jgi:PAS domain-containing protein
MFENINIITVVLSALVGFLTWVTSNFVSKRQSKRDDFKAISDAYTLEFERQNKKLLDLEARIQQCADNELEQASKIRNLQLTIKGLSIQGLQLPIPMWMKDELGTMISLNDEYEKLFLVPLGKTREDYIGKNDIDFWGKEIGEIYARNDQVVVQTKKPMVTLEPINTKDGMNKVYVIKYPYLINGNYVVGLGGIAIEEGFVESLIEKKINKV